jgi:hypothetical protein
MTHVEKICKFLLMWNQITQCERTKVEKLLTQNDVIRGDKWKTCHDKGKMFKMFTKT